MMGIFCNINKTKLNLIVDQIQSGRYSHQPGVGEITQIVFQSDDTTLKAAGCAMFLIEWQNNLDEQITDPNCKIFFDATGTAFDQFTQSQRTLNKLKRKFSRLVIKDMPLAQQESLLRESANNLKVRFPHVSVLQQLFQFHGDDAICLEMLGLYANHHLKIPHRPSGELLTLYGGANYRPDAHVVLSVSSTVEHFPFASNTWGFPGQVSWPSAAFTKEKASAVVQRRGEFLSKRPPVVRKMTPWSKVVPLSAFARNIHNSKCEDGSPIGNCGERSARIFRQLAKQRRFDSVARVYLKPGDHWFIEYSGAATSDKDNVDAWNGAKIYPKKYSKNLLKNYLGNYSILNGEPFVIPYDEDSQYIILDAYNIYPSEVFKNMSTTKYPFLCALLEEFHQIPNDKRKEKMLKALEIIRMIEHRMPLFEYIDPAVNELYDQMMYLTKKERKNGLQYIPPKGIQRCLINEALQNLDLNALRAHITDGQTADSLTIFHAIKAALRADDIRFLKEVVDAGVPIEKNAFTMHFHHDAGKAIQQLASLLSSATGMSDLELYCNQVVKKLNLGYYS